MGAFVLQRFFTVLVDYVIANPNLLVGFEFALGISCTLIKFASTVHQIVFVYDVIYNSTFVPVMKPNCP